MVHAYNPALRRLRQKDPKFKASLDYKVKLCLKKTRTKINKTKNKFTGE
jgi:hypothetical protein